MLVRAASRKARPAAIRNTTSYNELYLPWLCPAYNTAHRGQQRQVTIDVVPQKFGLRKRRNSQDGANVPSRRSLATAVSYRPFDDIPFESLRTTPEDGKFPSLSSLKPFEFSNPLMLGGSLAPAPQRYRVSRQGVGGEISEILAVLDACLQVGRIKRAKVILERIAKLDALGAEDLLTLHNRYLRAAVEQIMMNPSESAMQELHKWFELKMRILDSPQHAETVAYMLKTSLQSPPGNRRDRLVRRYMDMVQGDAGLEVLSLEILTAEELNTINHVCPTYNLAERPEDGIGDDMLVEPLACESTDQDQVGEEKSVPAVRETGQKGLGLKSLKKALSIFSNLPASGIDMVSLPHEQKREIQAQLEADAVQSAIDRWRDESAYLAKIGLNTSLQTKSLGARMWKWHVALQNYLADELVKVEEAELKEKKDLADMERCIYGPFLRYLPTDKLAAVTILAYMSTLGSLGVDKGMTLSNAIMAISNNVEDESVFESMQNNTKNIVWRNSKKGHGKGPMAVTLKKKAMRHRRPGSIAKAIDGLQSDDGASPSVIANQQWPVTMKAKVGAFLMSALIETAKVPVTLEHPETKVLVTQMQPAFSHAHQYKYGKKVGVILANAHLVKLLKREPVHSLLAKHLPMLVEPDPWTQFNKGGFVSHPAKIMRIKLGDKDQRHYAEAAIGKGDMEQTFKGLDILGKTAWRINQPVFDTMLEAWNSGEAVANIAPDNPKLQIPREPEASNDPSERRRWIRDVKLVENSRGGIHSQRCFQNFQLEIARALRNQTFYFPHNVDFRGRAYPIPPYLNHMGADHCRGLLTFGKGKKLGEFGLRWLKIHLANVFGFDKASLTEREAFAMDNMENIYDSALKPLNGRRWWLKAEDPWQCLAACMELRCALESPDATRYVSHLPIHQDGTCNGLQHYAALGGDVWGARQVNLEPGDRPADVYTAVANLVKESLARDLQKGHPCAKVLDGKITRKVVKQTVMTNVYGVTYIGAKAQVRKQLVAANSDLPNEPNMHAGVLSSYVATKIFAALSTMFRGAHDIQYWLGECASRICKSVTPEQMNRLETDWPRLESELAAIKKNQASTTVEDPIQFKSSVIWTNPLHMPVVQPYRLPRSRSVFTNLQRISLSEPHRSDPVSKRKQLQGFPPNFIHSLDATHMLLSALRCDELDLSFAAVHDSFWTHASDIDTMNDVLRDTFVRIHSENVIGRLAAEFGARYSESMYLAKLKSGTALYQKIRSLRESGRYSKRGKTSKGGSKKAQKIIELMNERKRIRLLGSSDPEEVKKGKKMVTPLSIFEEMAAEGDLAAEEDLTELGIGEVSTKEAQFHVEEEMDLTDGSNADGGEIFPRESGRVDADMIENTEETLEDGDEVGCSDDSADHLVDVFESHLLPQKRVKQDQDSWIWLPLTFPPVPKKGEFDVSRLKDSKYFFS